MFLLADIVFACFILATLYLARNCEASVGLASGVVCDFCFSDV